MIIGAPKEILDNEYRIALTPDGARALRAGGHRALVQRDGGAGSGFPDADYQRAGAELVRGAAPLFRRSEMVLKVKQPEPNELERLQPGQILFSYVHAENRPWLFEGLLKRRITAIAFEEIMLEDGSRPLLAPMSQVAGHTAVLIGSQLLQRHQGGMGVMMGRMDGVSTPLVVVLGGGAAGARAAEAAAGLKARVLVCEPVSRRRSQLRRLLPRSVGILPPDKRALSKRLREAALLINTTNWPERTPTHLVTRAMVRRMPQGAVIVDVTANRLGAIETSVRQTTHSSPTFVEEGVLHYVVPNIPGSVARTATLALAAATLPYVRAIADKGLVRALMEGKALRSGLICHAGKCTSKALADIYGVKCHPALAVLA